jgi:hypothetical protein
VATAVTMDVWAAHHQGHHGPDRNNRSVSGGKPKHVCWGSELRWHAESRQAGSCAGCGDRDLDTACCDMLCNLQACLAMTQSALGCSAGDLLQRLARRRGPKRMCWSVHPQMQVCERCAGTNVLLQHTVDLADTVPARPSHCSTCACCTTIS